MAKLLVVDDEPNTLYSFERCLQSDTLDVLPAATAHEGIALVQDAHPDAVILDVRLPDMSGLDAYERIHQIDPRLPVIVITAHGTTETAIEATRRGAFDYLLKPVEVHQLRDVVARALEVSRLNHVPAVVDSEPIGDGVADRIVGRAAAMQEVYKAIGRAAPQDVPVLIVGESGTGKELVARAIAHYSRRAAGPFAAINCAAIPEGALESELFGHEAGALVGAERQRIGRLEQARGGTVFLDEVGELTPATQAKLLRALQDQQFERVGGTESVATDVRIIAATSRDLARLVADGGFREDLFYRLDAFRIAVPPLRERLEDLAPLIEHFIRTFDREFGKSVRSVSPQAMRLLEIHTWPGNVRELQSVIRSAVVQATSEVITAASLPELRPSSSGAGPGAAEEHDVVVGQLVRQFLGDRKQDVYRRVCNRVDRVILEEVLRHVRGNQLQAAEILGISRTTLRAKLRALGLSIEKQIASDALAAVPRPGGPTS